MRFQKKLKQLVTPCLIWEELKYMVEVVDLEDIHKKVVSEEVTPREALWINIHIDISNIQQEDSLEDHSIGVSKGLLMLWLHHQIPTQTSSG
ncbi:hypothetical protein DPMN_181742 [Dreissena polymorpha]|uniref:Uncharacterized protein n=1 Tax=Dreissena polymorpha TaxID=45954 RepID=A0A9D4DCX0_DREPO|nr:hypothetical protein DPMN_181742 [Dreissena polymorpha]